jgi:hypothetical protein
LIRSGSREPAALLDRYENLARAARTLGQICVSWRFAAAWKQRGDARKTANKALLRPRGCLVSGATSRPTVLATKPLDERDDAADDKSEADHGGADHGGGAASANVGDDD